VPGHQVVGVVEEPSYGKRFKAGDRVGVAWLVSACGACRYCREGLENLCEKALFTGYDRDGGYAELVTADERFCYPIPPGYPDLSAAPLLCGGLIGFRAWRMCGPVERIGSVYARNLEVPSDGGVGTARAIAHAYSVSQPAAANYVFDRKPFARSWGPQ